MIQTAVTTERWMYRGSRFILPISVLDEGGQPAVLNVTDTAQLQIYDEFTQQAPLIVKAATNIYPDLGLITFTLNPADTANLPARAYDFSVHIRAADGSIFPIIKAKLGVVPFNPPVVPV